MAKRKRHDDLMLLATGEQVRGLSATYTIERVVGAGAFGCVYFAKDPSKLHRTVALKEFFAAKRPREQAALRDLFERERVVGLQASPHPLMPTFYEAFTFDGHYYIAQEYIEGSSLDEVIRKRSPLPREWILKWAVSLCDGLAYLHSRGIVHHDLKPPNIRITPQGHLTVLDFGAAQYFGKGHENEKPTEIYGTEGYLPPEIDGDGKWVADARTDIFALGCILYEMIAGEPPDQEQINARSMHVTKPLMEMPNADLNLVGLINKALSYNTEYRYNSMNEFLLDIRQFAPPVLLVNTKHIRFGDVTLGQHVAPMQVTLYNAGGGELRGEIKPRSPWIQVPVTSFRGNKREVNVIVSTAKVPERDVLQVGKLELNCPDVLDENGRIAYAGDRWFIECSVKIVLDSGVLQVVERPTNSSPPIGMRTRVGQPATATVQLKNIGEKPTQFKIETTVAGAPVTALLSGLTITPDRGTVPPGETAVLTLNLQTQRLVAGVHNGNIYIKTSGQQNITLPISVEVQSQLQFLKSRIMGGG